MEVATTNNHHHHSHHAHQHQQQLTVAGNGNSSGSSSNNNNSIMNNNGGSRSPFQREVREWQRIDPDTGALLSGRLEADRWINGPLNSYGKISDSQNISQPNGTQQTQRKQFEVLQARTPNGAMQVIRTQTVQTTSSRWSSSTTTTKSSSSSSTTSSPANILDRNTSSLNSCYNNKHCHIANNSCSPYHTTTRTLPTTNNAVDICEISDDDEVNEDVDEHRLNGDNIVVTLIDDDDDNKFDNDNDNKNEKFLFNGNANGHGHSLRSLRRLSHNLLLDMAPSLKLSNLMKSSSSISSQSSNNSYTNTTTSAAAAAATMNTHRNAAKISLHAIVGSSNNTKSATSSSTSSSSSLLTTAPTTTMEDRITAASSTATATTTTPPWHKRLSEQPDLYGNSNNKLNQSRVGVNSSASAGTDGGGGGGVGGVTASTTLPGGGGGGGGGAAVHQTPTQVNRQTRRDLESFRHYNEHAKSSIYNNNNDDDDNDANVDEDLRLTARHQRRQQVPQHAPIPLQRSRSISTDDLSNDWDRNDLGQNTDEEPGEWRRVSKLRRSFQSSTNSSSNSSNIANTPRRPLDLPSNSVSVSRIRAELENGRRLNTAMRNNHVDIAALDTILNANAAEKHAASVKRTTFLTAESLKEIRGKLKKLSDESLYKEDFLAYQTHRETPEFEEEHIEVQLVKPFVETQPPTRSAFQPVVRSGTQRTLFGSASSSSSGQSSQDQTTHKTHSLESRQKYRDTNSSEWHLRRKSYGFEKMSPPEDRSIFRVDASTDSGLGRSGDQLGNWSPTDPPTSTRGTIIHFGAPQQQQAITGYQRQLKSPDAGSETNELNKRHSIAVEESQYMRKTSQVHLNGINGGNCEAIVDASTSRTQHKRVEFCKTEVHFAAESGRVNIVETDGKPPPTNNFRRRRRVSAGPLQSLVKSASTVSTSSTATVGLPITHFGDDHRGKSITTSSTVAYKATLMEPPELVTQPTQVTVTIPKPLEVYSLSDSTSTSRNSYTSTSGIDTTTDNETDEISAIRGILKNKPIKPKPYHLGENIESADALWGVQLKSVQADRQQTDMDDAPASPKTVAERVRIVEKRQVDTETNSNGYSTKINLSLDDKDWNETGYNEPHQPQQQQQHRRPSAQELLLQDLREHQRILDEGLKSTSLIIRTMRSASAFDEAMRRLSIASVESALTPTIVVPTPMLRSNSYQGSTASSRRDSNATITSSDLYGSTLYDSLPRRFSHESFVPLAPPRLKLLGNTEIPVSQQLTQLRRMYDAAQDDMDSADEEVKSYFSGGAHNQHYENSDSGGGTQDTGSSLEDVRTATEYSSSWSRLKAKRTIWKIELDEEWQQKQQQQQQQKVQILKRADLPKSNVMSIALHSPKADQQQTSTTEIQKKPMLRVSQLVPVAKPRTTLSTVPTNTQPELHTAMCVKQSNDSTSDSDSLKIVKEARGARKLKEHELSYFGVQVSRLESMAKPSQQHQSSRRSLPSRKLSAEEKQSQSQTTTKWQLLNDRPDLLRHSPIEPQALSHGAELKAAERQSIKHKAVAEDEHFDEHFYENIAHELQPSFRVKSPSPNAYDRKMDVQRDVQILSEMTRNADQTLKAISDEAALKDQRRRSSLQRRSAKPLETIDEKSFTSDKTSESLSISRGTFASEARRNSRQSTPSPTQARSSSQSSIECCPRARSRSLSSEREYENIKPRRSAQHTKPATNSRRSSSRDSATQCSSGDEQLKREERLRTRTPKRVSNGSSNAQAREKQRHAGSSGSHHGVEKRQAMREEGTALKQRSSSMRERTERERKAMHERTHSSSRRNQNKHEESGEHRTSSRTNHGSGSGSGQRIRSHSSDRHERHSGTRLVRVSRGHEHESTGQRSSAHRAERHDKDKEKEKLSRSRGHSSRSSHSEREPKPTTRTTTTAATMNGITQAHRKSSSKSTSTSASKHAHKAQQSAQQQALNEHELTHGKNAQLLNGHHGHQHGPHNQHIQHSLATTTIAAKQRERHGKDRK